MRIFAIWVLAILCYSNSFRAGIIHDDVQLIDNDARVHAVTSDNVQKIFTEDYNRTGENLYRPLSTLTYLFNYAVLGNRENPAGYHLLNLLIHLFNMALVYWLGLLLFTEWAPALALAALWGVHPVLTEAVTNIVGRADMLAATGPLAGLLCHIYAQRSTGARRAAWLGGLALATAIGMFAKESGVVLPAVMLLYDIAFPGEVPWRKRWPGYAVMAVPIAVFFSLRGQLIATHPIGTVPFVDNPLRYADFLTAKLTALKFFSIYFRVFFWPVRLSADYSYNEIPLASFTDWRALLSALVCIGALAAGIMAWRRNRRASFFVLWFFVTIAPVANFFLPIGTSVAERLLYLPAVGLTGCVVLLLAHFLHGRTFAATVAAICCLFAVRTFVRNFDWYTSDSLWTATIQAAPAAFRGYSQLASAGMTGTPQQLDRAVAAAKESVRIVDALPDYENSSRIYSIAGQCYLRKADAGGGAEWYQGAYDTLSKGAKLLREEGDHLRTINAARNTRVHVGTEPVLYLGMAQAALRLGKPRDAVQVLLAEHDTRKDAAFAPLLSQAWLASEDTNAAGAALIEGLVLDPNAVQLAARLLDFYKKTEPQSCAIKGSAIDMNCPLVHTEVCTAWRNITKWYAQGGETAQASETAAGAVQQMGCPAAMFQ